MSVQSTYIYIYISLQNGGCKYFNHWNWNKLADSISDLPMDTADDNPREILKFKHEEKHRAGQGHFCNVAMSCVLTE